MKKTILLLFMILIVINVTYADETLFELVLTGSSEKVRNAIQAGSDVNVKGGNGTTPLMYAASFNRDPAVITTLLNAGADINAKDNYGSTALMSAAKDNAPPEIIIILLEAGAEVNAQNDQGATALMLAGGTTDNPNKIIALVENGADLNAMDNSGRTFWDYIKKNLYFMGIGRSDYRKLEEFLMKPVAALSGHYMKISASSVLPPGGGYHYGPELAFDGDPITAWSEGSDGDGTGEYLEIIFSTPIEADTIRFMPGYFDSRWYRDNCRVKNMQIHLFDDNGVRWDSISFEFQDRMIEQPVYLNARYTIKRARFEISRIYPGEKWSDLVISEITFVREGAPIRLSQDAP